MIYKKESLIRIPILCNNLGMWGFLGSIGNTKLGKFLIGVYEFN